MKKLLFVLILGTLMCMPANMFANTARSKCIEQCNKDYVDRKV